MPYVFIYFSGQSALLYQIVWFRMLSTLFGNTVYGTSAVLSLFMVGLGFGGWLGKKYVRTHPSITFSIYGVIECGIGALGLLSLSFYPLYKGLAETIGFIPMGWKDFLFKFLLVSPWLLPPTLLMGMTLPLFIRAFIDTMEDAEKKLGMAYGINTLGAFFGVIIGIFTLVPFLGFRRTLIIAVLFNIAVGIGALLYSNRINNASPVPTRFSQNHIPDRRPSSKKNFLLALIFFLTGFISIALEIVWTRIFTLHFGSSVYSYAIILAIVLAGIGIGSILFSRIRVFQIPKAWPFFLSLLSLSLWLNIFLLKHVQNLVDLFGNLFHPHHFLTVYSGFFCIGLIVLGLPALIMGVTFPLGIRIASRTEQTLAEQTGSLYMINSIGASIAAICLPLVLYPALKTNVTLFFIFSLALITPILSLFVGPSFGKKFRWGTEITLLLILIIAIVTWPKVSVLLHSPHFQQQTVKLIDFEEALTTTASVSKMDNGWMTYLSLETNGINVAGTSPELVIIQKFQGHLPLLFQQSPERVLHIGFGSGGTAYSVSLHPVKNIDVVEIAPIVVRMADKYFRSVNHNVTRDPRIHFYWGDGQNYLLSTSKKYDVILSDSIHPKYSGNGNLYTYDYFKIARNKLTEDGIFSMWLPMYSLTHRNLKMILRSFTLVFKHVSIWYFHRTINSYLVVMGTSGRPFSERIPGALTRLASPRIMNDLHRIGYKNPLAIFDNWVMDEKALLKSTLHTPLHTQDLPAVEFESTRLLEKESTWVENFRWLYTLKQPLTQLLPPGKPFPISNLKKAEQVRDLTLQGHMFFLDCKNENAVETYKIASKIDPTHKEPIEWATFRVIENISLFRCQK